MKTKTITIEDLEVIQDSILRSIERLQTIIEYSQSPEDWAIELQQDLKEANQTIEYVLL
jgi:hypothetical protein